MNQIDAKQLLFAAGPVMIPILLCSTTALTIIISKWRYFNSIKTNVALLKSQVFSLIRENKIKSAVTTCEKDASPAAQVLRAGLLKYGYPKEEIKETLENTVRLEIPKLEQGLVPLITIANTAPLFGVLGTVLGLTIIFQTLQNQNALIPTISHANLSAGIWQALLTTLAGLIVAIPSFVAYNYFVESINKTVSELNMLSNQLFNLLTHVHESTQNKITDMLEQ